MDQSIPLESDRELSRAGAVSTAFVTILIAHFVVDALAALVPSTLGVLEVRLALTAQQAAWLLGLGSFCSGISQPACALISDRLRTRTWGVVGLLLAALGIGALGVAKGMVPAAVIYAFAAIGIGMFHPIGAATIGHLQQQRRTSAVSLFFVAGMAGGVFGALTWPRFLSLPQGFHWLPLVILPVALLVVFLYRCYAELPPLPHQATETPHSNSPREAWAFVGVLFLSAALRFCVNLALLYLYVRWAQGQFLADHPNWNAEQVAAAAAPLIGNLNAATLAGMAMGGLSAGVFVQTGREKWPMILVPVLFAPLIGLFPYCPIQLGYGLAVAAGIGFAAMIPVTISLAQQLLPHRSNLASSMMMGGAWAVAMLGPRCAEFGIVQVGLHTSFLLTAVALALSGIVCLPLSNGVLARNGDKLN